MEEEEIKKLMITPLSNFDINKYLPNVPIYTYEQLGEFDDISQILPGKKSAIVLLFQQRENTGHWVGVVRDNKKIFFFCSYGNKPDKSLLWTPKYLRKSLGQNEPFLSHLLNKAVDDGYEVFFNSHVYQDKKNKYISTCGRHVINYINFKLTKKQNSDKDYYNYITSLCKKYNEVPDAIISRLVK